MASSGMRACPRLRSFWSCASLCTWFWLLLLTFRTSHLMTIHHPDLLLLLLWHSHCVLHVDLMSKGTFREYSAQNAVSFLFSYFSTLQVCFSNPSSPHHPTQDLFISSRSTISPVASGVFDAFFLALYLQWQHQPFVLQKAHLISVSILWMGWAHS